jgi:GTP-binding protein Era
MKSGFIAILGKPNVGKSSLMNRMVGEKVSIVSPKSQTTRDRILGILTTDEMQMIFIDTPGIHTPRSMLGRFMDKASRGAAGDADAVVIVLDATRRLFDDDITFIEKHLSKKNAPPVYVAVNKTDAAGFGKVYPILERLAGLTVKMPARAAVKEIIPVSARTGENVDKLKEFLAAELPDGVYYYPPDDLTDKTVRYQICEIVREKALLFLRDEIPHGVGVMVQVMRDGANLAEIEADIVVEKDSHKQIVIGAGGEQLKLIGERARQDIEKMLEKKVYLRLFVKVRKDWRNKRSVMDDVGYGSEK